MLSGLRLRRERRGALGRRRGLVGGARRERRLFAEHREVEAVVDPRGELVEHELRIGGELDAEAGGELRQPGELVGDRRDHGAAEALHAALEIHRRALAFERGGRGEDQVGPAGGERREERDDDHVVGALRERTHAGVRGRLVARDDEQPDPLGLGLVLVSGGRPGLRDASGVRRGGELERGAAGLALEAERVRGLREARAAAPARSRPDENGAFRGAEARAERVLRREQRLEGVG